MGQEKRGKGVKVILLGGVGKEVEMRTRRLYGGIRGKDTKKKFFSAG